MASRLPRVEERSRSDSRATGKFIERAERADLVVSAPVNSNDSQTPPAAETPPAPPEAAAAPEGEETVRKIYVKDLREKQRVNTVFRVAKKQRIQARSGKSFLALQLVDKTGELDARIFENVDAAEGLFQGEDFVLAEGTVILFHGKPQLAIEKIQRLDPEPLDPAEFAYVAPPPSEKPAPAAAPPLRPPRPSADRAVAQIRQLVERVQDRFVKALLLAFLDDPQIAKGLEIAPAAKGIHHAYKGGLAEHILSVMKLSLRIADHYPMADRDLLLAGALLHDIGKVSELSYERGNFDYTDEGKLVGHIVMTAQAIREKANQIPNFPRLLEHHLTHLVLAHHGQLEYGSPKLPVTLEAFLVHSIDLIDSRVHSWLELMARDPNEKWTSVEKLYERNLWKAAPPTAHGRPPAESRRGPRREKKPRPERTERAEQPGAPKEPRAEKEPRRAPERPERPPREHRGPPGERPPRRERPEREPKAGGLPKDLTFKPFSALAVTEPTPPQATPESAGRRPRTSPRANEGLGALEVGP